MTTDEKNIPNQPSAGLCRSAKVRTKTKSYNPIMPGKRYACAAAQMVEQEVLHPYSHVLFNHEEVQNEPDVSALIMTHISHKVGLKKWDKKVQRRMPFRDEEDPYEVQVHPYTWEGLYQRIEEHYTILPYFTKREEILHPKGNDSRRRQHIERLYTQGRL